jgi:hypothetical protein
MPKNTKFNQAWLNETDSDGVKLNIWLKEGENKSTFQCILCKQGILIVLIRVGVRFVNI